MTRDDLDVIRLNTVRGLCCKPATTLALTDQVERLLDLEDRVRAYHTARTAWETAWEGQPPFADEIETRKTTHEALRAASKTLERAILALVDRETSPPRSGP